MTDFKRGDIVRLKSGGCLMIVKWGVQLDGTPADSPPEGYRCLWHDNEGRPQEQVYHKDLLDGEAWFSEKVMRDFYRYTNGLRKAGDAEN